jgi:hypothetical protein
MYSFEDTVNCDGYQRWVFSYYLVSRACHCPHSTPWICHCNTLILYSVMTYVAHSTEAGCGLGVVGGGVAGGDGALGGGHESSVLRVAAGVAHLCNTQPGGACSGNSNIQITF